jgi:hypothetical protein
MPEFEGGKSNDKEKRSKRTASQLEGNSHTQAPSARSTRMSASHTQTSSVVASGTGTNIVVLAS